MALSTFLGTLAALGLRGLPRAARAAATGRILSPLIVPGITTATAVASGANHTCALLANGTTSGGAAATKLNRYSFVTDVLVPASSFATTASAASLSAFDFSAASSFALVSAASCSAAQRANSVR